MINWFEKKFDEDIPDDRFDDIYANVIKTPGRLREAIAGVDKAILTASLNEKWSIQENIGHLLDIEPLWIRRVNDIISELPVMRSADIKNLKTHFAEHNNNDAQTLINDLETSRNRWFPLLKDFNDEDRAKTSKHPRLEKPMNLLYLMHFISEHDEHHLATIHYLIETIGKMKP